jgi:hypothetical protein
MIAGNRDTMSFFENIGDPSSALASETANVSDDILAVINRVARQTATLYDNDPTGIKKALRFQEDFGWIPCNGVYKHFRGTNPDGSANDFCDFMKHNREPGATSEFRRILMHAVENNGSI